MRRFRARLAAAMVVATSAIVACKYAPDVGVAPTDAQADGPPVLPDAGPCAGPSAMCFASGSDAILRTCAAEGDDPVDTPCNWGCIATGTAHCGVFTPSGGAVLPEHLEAQAGQTLLDITIDADTQIDSDTGEIRGGLVRPAGSGVLAGIEFIERNGVGIFRFKSLTINNDVDPEGAQGIALVALESITVNGEVDLRRCGDNTCPGGGAGGSPDADAVGSGGGSGGNGNSDDASGGGGGAYAGSGGRGGAGASESRRDGGDPFGLPPIVILVGGGGGGGGGNDGGAGGNGGGAIQLVANGAITFSATGRINAGGCGGQAGQSGRAAGGGGAGGAILLEATTISLPAAAVLVANGGGGGGGDSGSSTNGANANFSTSPASGGNAGQNGGAGGVGAADVTLIGQDGESDLNGGGGGGGVGWIRINTLSGNAAIDPGAIISPTIATGSPASVGQTNVQ